jgi:hypothetical protein
MPGARRRYPDGRAASCIFGFPVPVIDAADARCGRKVIWNRAHNLLRTQVSVPSTSISGRAGLVRNVRQ